MLPRTLLILPFIEGPAARWQGLRRKYMKLSPYMDAVIGL